MKGEKNSLKCQSLAVLALVYRADKAAIRLGIADVQRELSCSYSTANRWVEAAYRLGFVSVHRRLYGANLGKWRWELYLADEGREYMQPRALQLELSGLS